MLFTFVRDQNGELEEQALKIVFYVLIAIGGLGILGAAVSGLFTDIACSLGVC